jgi:hypothetical protein
MPSINFAPAATATGIISVRYVADDGSVSRTTISPGHLLSDGMTFVATDVSGYAAEVQAECARVWTADVVAAFKAVLIANVRQPTAFDTWLSAIKADPARAAFVSAAQNATPAQIRSYVNNQITDLASAKTFIAVLVMFMLANMQS